MRVQLKCHQLSLHTGRVDKWARPIRQCRAGAHSLISNQCELITASVGRSWSSTQLAEGHFEIIDLSSPYFTHACLAVTIHICHAPANRLTHSALPTTDQLCHSAAKRGISRVVVTGTQLTADSDPTALRVSPVRCTASSRAKRKCAPFVDRV